MGSSGRSWLARCALGRGASQWRWPCHSAHARLGLGSVRLCARLASSRLEDCWPGSALASPAAPPQALRSVAWSSQGVGRQHEPATHQARASAHQPCRLTPSTKLQGCFANESARPCIFPRPTFSPSREIKFTEAGNVLFRQSYHTGFIFCMYHLVWIIRAQHCPRLHSPLVSAFQYCSFRSQ